VKASYKEGTHWLRSKFWLGGARNWKKLATLVWWRFLVT